MKAMIACLSWFSMKRWNTVSLSCSEIENDNDILAASPSLWHERKWVKPQKLSKNVTVYDKGPYDLLKGEVALYFHFLWWSLVTGWYQPADNRSIWSAIAQPLYFMNVYKRIELVTEYSANWILSP